jgi:hypothetical protein
MFLTSGLRDDVNEIKKQLKESNAQQARLQKGVDKITTNMSQVLGSMSATMSAVEGTESVPNSILIRVIHEATDTVLRQAATSSLGLFLSLLEAKGCDGRLNRQRAKTLKAIQFNVYPCHILTVLVQQVKSDQELQRLLGHEWSHLSVLDIRAVLACAESLSMGYHVCMMAFLNRQDSELVSAARAMETLSLPV